MEPDLGSSQESDSLPKTPGYMPPFNISSSESEVNSEASNDSAQIPQMLLFNFLDSVDVKKPHSQESLEQFKTIKKTPSETSRSSCWCSLEHSGSR